MTPIHQSDEKLFSWLARAEATGAFVNAQAASLAFFGHPTAGLKLDFPSNLRTLAQNQPQLFCDVNTVVRRATVLPYLGRFRPAHMYEAAVEQMSGLSVAQLKLRLGLQAGAQGPRSSLRLCRTSFEEDRARVGAGYWHRLHQLPGVHLCPHHEDLLVTTHRNVRVKQLSLFLPCESDLSRLGASQLRNSSALDQAWKISVLSRDALEKPLPGGFDTNALYSPGTPGECSAIFVIQPIAPSCVGKMASNLLARLQREPFSLDLNVLSAAEFLHQMDLSGLHRGLTNAEN